MTWSVQSNVFWELLEINNYEEIFLFVLSISLISLFLFIYIYCHPHTDCFVVSQLFSVARHVGSLKLGSKPAQLDVRLSIRPLGQRVYHVCHYTLNIRYYVATTTEAAALVCLHFIPYRIPKCSLRSKSFALWKQQPKIPSPKCSTPIGKRIYTYIYIYIYIYIRRLTSKPQF